MDIREAARQAIDEAIESRGSLCGSIAVSGRANFEHLILRAFALAGYGWRDIAEAKKDGTRYPVATGGGSFAIGSYFSHGDRDEKGVLPSVKRQYKKEFWGAASKARRDGWYSDQSEYFEPQPTMFYELPPPPTKGAV